MSKYWLINLLSVSVPLLASFHPKLAMYKRWKYWFPAMLISATVFIFWDVWFTSAKVWSFNTDYVAQAKLIGMPLEEWAFFFLIPYACIFTFESFRKLVPNFRIRLQASKIISWALIAYWVIALALNLGHMYTMVCYGISAAVLLLCILQYPNILRSYLPVFLILLVPFVLVNGVLTGSFGDAAIVSYDDTYNMGLRILNIPIEDFSYAFTLILMSLVFIRFFEELFPEKQTS